MRQITVLVRVGAIAAGFAVLSGCVAAVPTPAPGLDTAATAVVEKAWIDNTWQRSGLAVEVRPADPAVVLIDLDRWGAEIIACMSVAGYDIYAAFAGGYTRSATTLPTPDENLALYLCEASRQLSPEDSGHLNDAQIEYLYDYYRLDLVPCLERAGVRLEGAPSREEFRASSGRWNPYFAMEPSVRREVTRGSLRESCRPNAPGTSMEWGF